MAGKVDESVLIQGDDNVNQKPLVTIFIPTFKRPLLFEEALKSALNQKKFNDYEILILDNQAEFGDSNLTLPIVKKYQDKKIRYFINKENTGMTRNWNIGLRKAKGEWFIMLHDDDLLYENFLFNCQNLFRNNNINFLVNDVDEGMKFNNERIIEKPVFFKELKNIEFAFGNVSPVIGVCFRTGLVQFDFDENDYPVMDYVFWKNYVLLNGKAYKTNIKQGFYRRTVSESNNIKTLMLMAQKEIAIRKSVLESLNKPSLIRDLILFYGRNALANFLVNGKEIDKSEVEKLFGKKVSLGFAFKFLNKTYEIWKNWEYKFRK